MYVDTFQTTVYLTFLTRKIQFYLISFLYLIVPSSVSSDDDDDARSQVSFSSDGGSLADGDPLFRIFDNPKLENSGSINIHYRASWVKKEQRSKKPKLIANYVSSKPIELQPYTPSTSLGDSKPKPFFEITKTFRASQTNSESSHEKAEAPLFSNRVTAPIEETDEESREPPGMVGDETTTAATAVRSSDSKEVEKVPLKDLRIHEVWTTRIKIWSPIILSNLHAHTQIFEGYDEYGRDRTPGCFFSEPYYGLLWNSNTIQRLAQPPPVEPLPGKSDEHTQYSDTERSTHFSELLKFIETAASNTLFATQNLLLSPAPVMPFNMLSWIFSEGVEVYIRPENERDLPSAGLVSSITSFSKSLLVSYWRIGASGGAFGRRRYDVFMEHYQSERKLTTLPIFPARFLDDEDGGATRHALIEKGKIYYNLIQGGQKEMIHSGKAHDATKNPSSFNVSPSSIVLTLADSISIMAMWLWIMLAP